jgi:hypothetical protein
VSIPTHTISRFGSACTTTPFIFDNDGGPRLLHQFHCRDPRDKIFALLALASDSEALGIMPDYTKNVGKLFIDAAARILEHYPSLEILRVVDLYH